MIENGTLLTEKEEWTIIEGFATLFRNGGNYWVKLWDSTGKVVDMQYLTKFKPATVYQIFELAGLTEGQADIAMTRCGFGWNRPKKGE